MPADGTFAPTGTMVDSAFNPRLLPVVWRRPISDIAAEVAERRGNVTAAEILGPSRAYRVAHARHEVVWLARELGYTLHMIGRRFPRPENPSGYVDHTTVLAAERAHLRRRREETMVVVVRGNDEAAMAYRDYLRKVAP